MDEEADEDGGSSKSVDLGVSGVALAVPGASKEASGSASLSAFTFNFRDRRKGFDAFLEDRK